MTQFFISKVLYSNSVACENSSSKINAKTNSIHKQKRYYNSFKIAADNQRLTANTIH